MTNDQGQINGRKRFIVTDTLGLLLTVCVAVCVTVCAASVQDRDGAKTALVGAYLTPPACRFVFADAGFAGRLVGWAHDVLATTLSIVRTHQIRRASRCSPDGGRWNEPWPG